MLHQIKPIYDIDRLKRILEFQRAVLSFVCDSTTPICPDEQTIRDAFSDAGDWLWGRMRNSKGGKSEVCAALERMIQYCHDHPDKRQELLEAFDHDIEFDKNLDEPYFQFYYSTKLDEDVQEVIKPLMVAFYTDLLASGYPESIQGEKKSFNRREFIKAFYVTNSELNVCPACDGKRADKAKGFVRADADHSLPKSVYPFLSVHPANLVPLCIECNRSFKLDRDPIDDHEDHPLPNVFHPYDRPAIKHITVKVINASKGKEIMQITEKDGSVSRRVDSLNRVFDLEVRLGGRLEKVKKTMIDNLRDWRHLIESSGLQPDGNLLRNQLDYVQKSRDREAGSAEDYLLQASYMRFALEDANEFDLLLKSFTDL